MPITLDCIRKYSFSPWMHASLSKATVAGDPQDRRLRTPENFSVDPHRNEKEKPLEKPRPNRYYLFAQLRCDRFDTTSSYGIVITSSSEFRSQITPNQAMQRTAGRSDV